MADDNIRQSPENSPSNALSQEKIRPMEGQMRNYMTKSL
jgi:hypothetical protein